MSRLLNAEDVVVTGPEGALVRGVTVALNRGECFTVLGESGSGKSLLAQAILGLLPRGLQAHGRIEVDGRESAAGDARARRPLWGRTLSLLPQEPWLALDPTMRIAPQVAEVHVALRGAAPAAAAAAAQRDLEGVGLAGAGRAFPHELSGGMAQRAALAVSRAGDAPVLIVDEPTKGLDAPLRDRVVDDLLRVTAGDGAVFTITHDVHVARRLGGRVAVMLDGAVVETGAAEEVLGRPSHPYTRALLAADPDAWAPRAEAGDAADPVVTARGIAKAYGGKGVFEDLDLTIGRGERVAVTGPSGSGKSTLGNVLLGLRAPDRGTVTRAPGLPPHAFQKLYQDPIAGFPPGVSLRQAFADLIRLHDLDWGAAETMIGRLRLRAALLERRPSEVSSGELQRFAAVRALLLRPALIFADEPTSRLDPISQKETFDLLVEGAAAAGSALLMVTHDPHIARALSPRLVRLGGRP